MIVSSIVAGAAIVLLWGVANLSWTDAAAFVGGTTPFRSSLLPLKAQVPTRSKLTPAQRVLLKNKGPALLSSDSEATSEFEKIKSMAYALGDGLTTLASKTPTNKIVDGYNGLKKTNNINKTPTQQLLQVLVKRPLDSKNNKKLVEPIPTRSVFDSVKGAIYTTADIASSIATTAAKSRKSNNNNLSSSAPLVKSRLETSRPVRNILPDLQSTNPLQRWTAEWKLRDMEWQARVASQQAQVTSAVDDFKDNFYTTADLVSKIATDIVEAPDRIQAWVESIPSTIDTWTSRAEQQVNAVQTGVVKTVDQTIQVVEDVKAIPSRVQQSVETTTKNVKAIPSRVQQSVETTKQNVNAAVSAVEEVSTSAKVLLGLEKPKPRPPKRPPPAPPGASDLAWRAVGAVMTGTGRAVWWISSNAAQLAYQSMAQGVQQMMEQAKTSKNSPMLKPVSVVSSNGKTLSLESSATAVLNQGSHSTTMVQESTTKPAESLIAKQVDEELNREIAEALQMANEELLSLNSNNINYKSDATEKNDLV